LEINEDDEYFFNIKTPNANSDLKTRITLSQNKRGAKGNPASKKAFLTGV
jgi:hypothetical protein